ncbi:MAG: hypothetical protein CMO80_04680 [Verrucomicrobiales bacterium]|nr:hypothetical protein [Verrucomicrobiales bacterium]
MIVTACRHRHAQAARFLLGFWCRGGRPEKCIQSAELSGVDGEFVLQLFAVSRDHRPEVFPIQATLSDFPDVLQVALTEEARKTKRIRTMSRIVHVEAGTVPGATLLENDVSVIGVAESRRSRQRLGLRQSSAAFLAIRLNTRVLGMMIVAKGHEPVVSTVLVLSG